MSVQSENDGRGEDTHPAYSGVMLRCGDKVLLCKRRDDIGDEYLPGYWSVPAGYVEEDEEIKTCAIRETFEETKEELTEANLEMPEFGSSCVLNRAVHFAYKR